MQLHGLRVLITGASSGIGAALAQEMARRGARVGLLARRRTLLDQVLSTIQKSGGTAWALPADLMSEDDANRAAREFEAAAGGIDVLVNNAGVLGPRVPIDQYPSEQFASALMGNAMTAFLATRACMPTLMQARPGLVLNISSYLGRHGLPNCAGYVTGKFALEGLTAALSSETEGSELVVASLSPGMVATDMLAAYLGTHELGQFLPPEDVAKAICRLVEQASPQMHGAQLEIDSWLEIPA